MTLTIQKTIAFLLVTVLTLSGLQAHGSPISHPAAGGICRAQEDAFPYTPVSAPFYAQDIEFDYLTFCSKGSNFKNNSLFCCFMALTFPPKVTSAYFNNLRNQWCSLVRSQKNIPQAPLEVCFDNDTIAHTKPKKTCKDLHEQDFSAARASNETIYDDLVQKAFPEKSNFERHTSHPTPLSESPIGRDTCATPDSLLINSFQDNRSTVGGGARRPFRPFVMESSKPFFQRFRQTGYESCPRTNQTMHHENPFCSWTPEMPSPPKFFKENWATQEEYGWAKTLFNGITDRIKSILLHTFPSTPLSEMSPPQIVSQMIYQLLTYGVNRVSSALKKAGKKLPTELEFKLLGAVFHSYPSLATLLPGQIMALMRAPHTYKPTIPLSDSNASLAKSTILLLHFVIPLLTMLYDIYGEDPVGKILNEYESFRTAGEWISYISTKLSGLLDTNVITFLTGWSPDQKGYGYYIEPLFKLLEVKNLLFILISYHQGFGNVFVPRLKLEFIKNICYNFGLLFAPETKNLAAGDAAKAIYKIIGRAEKLESYTTTETGPKTITSGVIIVGYLPLLWDLCTSLSQVARKWEEKLRDYDGRILSSLKTFGAYMAISSGFYDNVIIFGVKQLSFLLSLVSLSIAPLIRGWSFRIF